jgi:hypothetical protein
MQAIEWHRGFEIKIRGCVLGITCHLQAVQNSAGRSEALANNWLN